MVKKNRRSCLKGRPAVLGIKTGNDPETSGKRALKPFRNLSLQ